MRRPARHLTPYLLAPLLLTACATHPPQPITRPAQPGLTAFDPHLAPYIRDPPEPFSRANAIAVAQREWRAFGSIVDDAPPGANIPKDLRPDQQPGLWQRVADYWWVGQDYGAPEGGWNSRYTESGTPYAGTAPAWSAAFISYVMRVAGAGSRFPYTPLHADYINAAARGEGVLQAERPESYVPTPGDLICLGRAGAEAMRFDNLPAPRFFGHCDVVIAATPGLLTVIGGNVAAAVTEKHVPTTPAGTLADASGLVVDSRYPWFVVLHIAYDS